MSNVAVRVDDVWKRFHRGERQDSLRDLIPALVRKVKAPRRAGDAEEALATGDFWAVREVGFEVEFGRALGIIGPNGAGKSTMLKLLTGILRPSRGEIRMRGRLASLIEVSAGFHQDLTGRENVFLQGAIMGMSRDEVRRRLDSIVDFSGIEAFIDTPVKRYSSGMNARLGFSIAVHLEPDVLVIDEVLSVGDMAFQEKCVQRMKAFKRDGAAIVFVSHNMQAVGDLCDEALVLKSSPRYMGPVGEAVAEYLRQSGSTAEKESQDGAALLATRLVDADGRSVEAVGPHAAVTLETELRFDVDLPELVFGVQLHRATDLTWVYDGNFTTQELGLVDGVRAGETLKLRFPHTLPLTRGQYSYTFVVYDPREARPRLWAAPVAWVRVDEYRTFAGIADLAMTIERDEAHVA